MSVTIPDCCLGCPNHPMNGGYATCAFCTHAVNGGPPVNYTIYRYSKCK